MKLLTEKGHAGVELATGLGKSLIISMLLKHYGLPGIVVAPTLNIAQQLFKELTRLFGRKRVGQFFDGKKEATKHFVVAVSKSLTLLQPGDPLAVQLASKSVLIGDECFLADARVQTDCGDRTISSIVYEVCKNKPVRVLSFNSDTKTFEFRSVLAGTKRPMPAYIRVIKFLRRSIRCTDNHKFLTLDGNWVRADELKSGDPVVGWEKTTSKSSSGLRLPNADQTALILGGYLGDGSLETRYAEAYRIKFNHCKKQRPYNEWKATVLGVNCEDFISGGYKKGAPMCRVTSKMFFLPHKLSRKKEIPQSVVEQIDAKVLAIWFMDDGYGDGVFNAVLNTHSFTKETVDRLVQRLLELGVSCKAALAKKRYWIIRICKAGYITLSKMVAPYCHRSMAYKVHLDQRPMVGTYIWNAAWRSERVFLVKNVDVVKSPKSYKEYDKFVYDIQVEGNHNYIVSANKGISGVVAHNCHLLPADTLSRAVLGFLGNIPYRSFLSGTQLRTDGLDLLLKGITGDILLEMDVKQGVDEGYLARPRFFQWRIASDRALNIDDPIKMNRLHLHDNSAVYQHAAMLVNKAVKVLGRRALVLVEEMGQFAQLQKAGLEVEARFAHGGVDAKNRKLVPEAHWKSDPMALVEAFDRGDYPCLVGTSCIGIGTNIRSASFIIDLVGGKSEIRLRQSVGRGTRLFPGKTDCIYNDYSLWNIPMLQKQAAVRAKIFESIYGPVTYL